MNSFRSQILSVFFLVMPILITACNGLIGPSPGDLAKVDQVEIVTRPGNPTSYLAVVSGVLPDGCTILGQTRQRVVDKTIKITLTTQKAEEACTQLASVPFQKRIRLQVNGLTAGSYTVEVNGAVASFFLMDG